MPDAPLEQLQAQIEELRDSVTRGRTALKDKWRHWGVMRGDNVSGALNAISTTAKPTVTVLLGYCGTLYQKTADGVAAVLLEPPINRITSYATGSAATLTMETYADNGFLTSGAVAYVKTDDTPRVTLGVLYASNPTADEVVLADYVLSLGTPLALNALAADPTEGTPSDGWLLYRTDTDRARLRANGAWVNLATTDDLSGYTRVYYKANNGTSGTGPAVTTSETSLGSFTITGGDMGTTGVMRVKMSGTFTGSGASTTVTIRIKLGSTTLYADASVATTSASVPWFLEAWLANVGSASIQRLGGFVLIGAPTATTGSGDLGTDEIVSTTPIYGTASENTAGDLTFNITAELSSGTSPNSFINFSTVAELL